MDFDKKNVIEGAVTLELIGYLAELKASPIGEDFFLHDNPTVTRVLTEMGIPYQGIDKFIVNGSLVSAAYRLSVGDTLVLTPLTID